MPKPIRTNSPDDDRVVSEPVNEQASLWTRRTFLRAAGGFGMAAFLAACGGDEPGRSIDADGVGRVLIIGAGPAGLTAAHLLVQRGVDVEVLEAHSTHGGRMRHDLTFADFPIPLGAEWVHVGPDILDEIVNDPTVEITTRLTDYGDDAQLGWYVDGELDLLPLDDRDLKFAGSSWLAFFDEHIVPGIADRMTYDTTVVTIEHDDGGVRVFDAAGVVHEAARAIVTVPLKILQLREIEFRPPLSDDRLAVIDAAPIWSGLKAFFEFDEAFFPAALTSPGIDTEAGQRLFYDAAYGQDTSMNVLGLFTVGDWAERYQSMTFDELRDDVLAELDDVFDGAASRSYLRHLVQNWNDEPYARAAYLADEADSSISTRLAEPVSERLLFAGDAYTEFDDWSSVHTATRSAADAVRRLGS